MRIAWMFTLVACGGWAQGVQNVDFSWTFGGASASATVVPGTNQMISGTAGAATQIDFGYQLRATKAGNLWIEIPATFVWQGTGSISGGTVASVDRTIWYVTPGVRLKSPSYGRFSFYGLVGGGVGTRQELNGVVNASTATVSVNTSVHIVPAFDFAGGIDLRLSRLLSLRAEERDFVTEAGFGGSTGHNHPVFLIGLAFHF